ALRAGGSRRRLGEPQLLDLRRRAGRARAVVVADHDQHRSDRDDLALGHQDPRDLAGRGRRDLDRRLVGLHLDERVILGDLLAFLDEPARDLAFRQALAEIRELELVRHQCEKRMASWRSTAWTPRTPLTSCVTRRSTTALAN